MVCIICEGELEPLGQLGRTFWYRCRQCGMEQHSDDDLTETLDVMEVR